MNGKVEGACECGRYRVLVFWAVLSLSAVAPAQTLQRSPEITSFMGLEVVVTEPQLDDVFAPKGPAVMRVEAPPQKQCYTMPQGFGRNPRITIVPLKKDGPALFFSAESGGVTSFQTHFALLRPEEGPELGELLLSDVTLSNVAEHEFWTEPIISAALIFLTADVVRGPGAEHNSDARFMIAAYFPTDSDPVYYLEDRFMTVRKYGLRSGVPVLAAEKPQILVRLKRVVAARKARKQN